ncbi:hypothetical protein FEM48_ZijujUnG0051900 [Ziziphus jujuba var. spinosa]|uniref:Uncharacterized protein n=1 Tax=Ziziphus jujuba var. spinosa TaxID=714518 RepID=A0A978U957_ZIZJJ|nr:hypothetical protein FEM48_ZijujUnG0051900 [Ziziphus jujuba var. spinosa]
MAEYSGSVMANEATSLASQVFNANNDIFGSHFGRPVFNSGRVSTHSSQVQTSNFPGTLLNGNLSQGNYGGFAFGCQGGIGYMNQQGFRSNVPTSLGSSNIHCALPMLPSTLSFPQTGVNESSNNVVNNGISARWILSVVSEANTIPEAQVRDQLFSDRNNSFCVLYGVLDSDSHNHVVSGSDTTPTETTFLSPIGYTTHNNDNILTSPTAQTTQNNGVTISLSSTSPQSAQQFPSVSNSPDVFTNPNNVSNMQIVNISNTQIDCQVVPLDLQLEAETNKMFPPIANTMTRATQKGCLNHPMQTRSKSGIFKPMYLVTA